MITIVAGLGRCGSSMLMKMLIKAGLHETGVAEAPLWEDGRVTTLPNHHAWLADCEGGVLKLLAPHRMAVPSGGDYRWLWLDRDPVEQKKSQHKMAAWMKRKRIPFKIAKWRAESLAAIKKAGGPVLMLQYETILEHPMIESVKICNFLRLDVNPLLAAREVRKREAKCLLEMAEGNYVPGFRVVR